MWILPLCLSESSLHLFLLSLRGFVVDQVIIGENPLFYSWGWDRVPSDRIITSRYEAQEYPCVEHSWLWWEGWTTQMSRPHSGPYWYYYHHHCYYYYHYHIIIISYHYRYYYLYRKFLSEILNRFMTTSFWEVDFEIICYKMLLGKATM